MIKFVITFNNYFMKKVGILIVLAILLMNCKKEEQRINYASFGAKISTVKSISKNDMMDKFSALKVGDTIDVKFESKVNKVCKAKGCWMKVDLGNDEASMVKFKDYGFFVPMNSEERKVIVNGKAYVTEVTVKELKHIAKDAGKTDDEIAQIKNPEYSYAFIADGVLMEE